MTEQECINRNIMECKGFQIVIESAGNISINRNIMECKVKILLSYHKRTGVLIETLWNVKLLIVIKQEHSVSRINRNIMECKEEIKHFHSLKQFWVLIETLWNVKTVCCTFPGTLRHVLIETLWNVKFLHTVFWISVHMY